VKPGDAVEVYLIWAGGSRATSVDWFGGYELVSCDGGVAVVRHTSGDFEGCEVNYEVGAVRKARGKRSR
jgi:hypothetical protein